MQQETIDPNQPLRLETAARLKFPDGSVSVAALRKLIKSDRLVAWRVAGKDLTSIHELDRMLERCRVTKNLPDFGTESLARQRMAEAPKTGPGSSSTVDVKSAQAAAKATLEALKRRLPRTSPNATSYQEGAGR